MVMAKPLYIEPMLTVITQVVVALDAALADWIGRGIELTALRLNHSALVDGPVEHAPGSALLCALRGGVVPRAVPGPRCLAGESAPPPGPRGLATRRLLVPGYCRLAGLATLVLPDALSTR